MKAKKLGSNAERVAWSEPASENASAAGWPAEPQALASSTGRKAEPLGSDAERVAWAEPASENASAAGWPAEPLALASSTDSSLSYLLMLCVYA